MPAATNTILQDRLVIDMSEKIAELEPNKSPLITLTKKMKKKRTVDRPEYDWMEQDPGNRWDAINNTTGYLATDTELVVDNAAAVEPPHPLDTVSVSVASATAVTSITSLVLGTFTMSPARK